MPMDAAALEPTRRAEYGHLAGATPGSRRRTRARRYHGQRPRAICTDNRPATADIGVSSGRPPCASSTVS